MTGATTVLGRSLAGRASDAIGRKIVSIICGLLGVGALIWIIGLKDLWMLYLFAAASGLFWGGLSTMVIAVTGDIFGLRNIGALVGAQNIALVLGAAIGPLIGGFVFDANNDYSAAFVAGAVGMSVATLLAALVRGKTDRGKRNV